MSPPVKRNDSTGWRRGTGHYSKSDAGVSKSETGSQSKTTIADAIKEVGSRKGGYSAPVSKSRNHP